MTSMNKQMFEAAAWTFAQFVLVNIGPAILVVDKLDWNGLWAAAAPVLLGAAGAVASLIKSFVLQKVNANTSIFISGGDVQ